jgi:signal transduction histidine kinase
MKLLTWRRPATFRVAGVLALALAVLLIVTNEAGYRVSEDLTARREALVDARLAVARIRRVVLLMESAQRGFMLTARVEDREPYDRLRQDITSMAEQLRQQSDSLGIQPELVRQLADVVDRKVSELQEVLRLFDKGDREAALNLMLTGIGRDQMDQINQLVDSAIRETEQAYARGGDLRDQVRFWTRAAIVLMVLLCLGAVHATLTQHRERERDRSQFLRDLEAERDKLEAEVQRRTQELTDLARHLQTVREDERSRLARELHDELGGLLTAAKLDVARVRKRLAASGPEAGERIDHLSQMLDAGIALKRRIIEDLRPSSLDNLGLPRTLEILCSDFARTADVALSTEIDELPLRGERALAIYRLVQEALTNVAKYARARHVQVSLHEVEGHACVQVRDDGLGFDPSTALQQGGHGLNGMRFRMQSCGGDWLLDSAPGRGTLVQASVPM